MKRILLFTLIISSLIVQTFGQSVERKQYKATKIAIAPLINGILDDEAWKSGEWVDDFTQNEPYNGRPASQRTEFKILFDDNNLYVGFKAYDTNPDSIVNRLTRRDQADGDRVGIIVDSYHDLRTAFLFGVSSTGVKYDQMYTDDGQIQDTSWDPNWWVKTSVNKEGWVAEMRIPLSQVRFEKNSGDLWGLEMARVLYRKNETSFWQHIPKDAPGLVHLFGELTGLENIKPRKIFDVTPYGVARTETYKTEPNNPFLASGKSSGLNAGVDAKIGVTNNMTMDLTINPDFGQVEADPSEVNLTAYETFFSEKRPFFIEGNNITNFNLGVGDGNPGSDNLFYSRRIGRRPQLDLSLGDNEYADIPTTTRILGAVKLTGKSKKGLSVGFIESVTEPEYAEIKKYIPSELRYDKRFEKVEPLTNYFVGRVQKDFNKGKTLIGGMVTSTNRALDGSLNDNMHRSAYTGGVDFTQYFKEKDWMFNLKTAFSDVMGTKKAITNTQKSSARYFQRPDQKYAALDTNRTSLAGSGGRIQIQKLNGHWNFLSSTTWKSPGFELNDLGFIREADQILTVLWAGYNQWEPKGIYRNYNINGDFYSFWNFGGKQLGKGFEWNASMNLKNFWSVWTGGSVSGNNLNPSLLRGGPMIKTPGNFSQRIGFSTDNRKKLMAEIYANYNRSFENYTNSFNTGLDLTIKPSNYLSVTLSPGLSNSFNELQYVTKTSFGTDDRYVFASIYRKTISTSFRVNINLSPDLTLQYWGQPFIASGKYKNYKYITNPDAAKYSERFQVYNNDQFISGPDDLNIDENKDSAPDYGFEKPDFNVQYFLSNLVIRWEYNPGSSIYIVWSQTRNSSNETGNLDLANNLGDLFDKSNSKPNNVFLLKFSYRFGLR